MDAVAIATVSDVIEAKISCFGRLIMTTNRTPVGEIRPSQLLWTYGPGALIDPDLLRTGAA